MNRLPTGMYLPGDSLIHLLDSRIKLIILFITILAILLVNSLVGYGIMVVFITIAMYLSRLSLNIALNAVSNLYWFFLVVLLMNTAFYSPENAWFSFWIFTPSLVGLMQGIDVVLRVFLVLIFSNVITSATAPLEITRALESIIRPMKYIGFPTEQIAMILSVAIQFIPTLSEETEMIRKAQMARGAKFDSPKLTEKAKAILPLVIPIFFSAFKRADELSIAMEARGYRGSGSKIPRKYKPLQFQDYGALVIVILIGVMQILLR